MRVLGTILAVLAVFGVAASTALAAPPGQTISFALQAQYSSIVGGYDLGRATFDGRISGDQVSRLGGTIDFGLATETLSLDPDGIATIGDQTFTAYWQGMTCDMFGCRYSSGTSTYTHSVGTVPVDVRMGALHGPGTLRWVGAATCVADCPPAGAWTWLPQAEGSLSASLTSAREAGFLYMSGPAPVIR
jgi:hypothetical protein